MREILFRGKENPSGDWVEGFLVGNCHIGDWVSCAPVHSKTVCQFTGLTDKNGKKIFEGDILSNHYFAEPDEEWDDLYVVEMVGGAWVATLVEDGTLSTEYVPDNLLLYSYADSEIIGNIHDNPELLEVEE